MFFFQGSLCLWLLAQTSPTQEEEKQSYEIGWSLRLLQSNDKEGDADNAVALKWHFQRLHKGEKGKAGDRLNNCLSGLWTFQVGRKGHGRISLQGSQASKGFYKGILMQTSSCKPLPTWVYLCCVHLVEKKKKKTFWRLQSQAKCIHKEHHAGHAFPRSSFCTVTENTSYTHWKVGQKATVSWSKISAWRGAFC